MSMSTPRTIVHSESPLHKAIRENDINLFNDLIFKGNNSMQDSNGDNVVHVAAKEGRLEMLKVLAKTSDLNALNRAGEPLLEIAFREQNADMVRFLIMQPNIDINVKFKDGSTLLHNIVKSADELNLLEDSLNHGAKIITQDGRGNTPLHYAINLAYKNPDLRLQFTDIALTLIERSKDPSVFTQPNLLRNTCLAIALKTGNKAVLDSMAKKLGLAEVIDTAQKIIKTTSNSGFKELPQRLSDKKPQAVR
jgi:ankyrin repeat protein